MKFEKDEYVDIVGTQIDIGDTVETCRGGGHCGALIKHGPFNGRVIGFGSWRHFPQLHILSENGGRKRKINMLAKNARVIQVLYRSGGKKTIQPFSQISSRK